MHDVRSVRLQQASNDLRRAGMDRKLKGNTHRGTVDMHAVDLVPTRKDALVTTSCRDHPDVMASKHLVLGQGRHLGFDPTRARRIAIADMGNPHAMTLPR